MNQSICVGLFGTCGGSRWREPFMARYQAAGIDFFDPQVPDWNPALAEVEAKHLVEDQVILFPVTSETYATGSLAETGYSILSALRSNTNRFLVVHIAPDLAPELMEKNPLAAEESIRARCLVRAHLEKLDHPNVFVVNSVEAMLPLSLELVAISKRLLALRQPKAPRARNGP